jgi:hypothetical protein
MSIENLAEFKHKPLNRQTRNSQPFRLLEIQPCTEQASKIQCTLHHSNLLAKPSFKALSYVWGAPTTKIPILLDKNRYDVTRNCYSALLRLRELGEDRVWIDAICIDQTNNEEKSAQIPMMKHIYAAAETIVWLGHPEEQRKPDSWETESMAFSLLEHLSHEQFRSFDSFIELATRETFSERHWKAVNDILGHSWFTRLWTHQEFILAKSTTLVSDYHSLTFSEFLLAITNIGNALDQIPSKRLPQFLQEMFANHAGMKGLRRARMRTLARTNRKNPHHLPYQRISLLSQVDVGREYDCSHDHDRVYGVLGLFDPEIAKRIQVDYDKPVELVYTNLATVIFETSRSMEGLTHAGIFQGPISCPSWVIDWRADTEKQPRQIDYERYWADCGTAPNYSVSMADLELMVRGVTVDDILNLVKYDNILYDCQHHLSGAKGFYVWKEHFSEYPTGSDPLHAWIRTITADLAGRRVGVDRITPDMLQGFEAAHHWGDKSLDEQKLMLPAKEEEKDDWIAWFLDACLRFTEAVAALARRRTFFISSRGYMGMGPVPLREGDLITVVLGCSVPLLVRQTGDHHVLIGECFVWGLMDGEALRGRKADDELDTFRLR